MDLKDYLVRIDVEVSGPYYGCLEWYIL